MRIGYLIPEFPGQTHIWMWREISLLRSWGAQIRILATRRPPERDRARHDFAANAAAETTYLWPQPYPNLLSTLAWAATTRPLALLRCVWLALRLPVTTRPRWRHVLPLIIPACVLARKARRGGVTHLHSQSCKNSAILCMMVKRLTATPYSLVLNANIDWWGGAMREKFCESAFIVTHARWLLEQVRRDYPELPRANILRASIGVDTHLWKPPEGAERPRQAPFRIVSVGRLHPSKGHDVLIQAIEILWRKGLDVELRIVGAGPARAELEQTITSLELCDRVFLLGSQPEHRVREELSRADAFALASHAEPLGVVYMEAMALGVPTVGTDAGGVTEIIIDGESGLLVPPCNPPALAAAIQRVATDSALRARLAAAGRKRIEQQFDSRLGAARLYERFFEPKPDTPGGPWAPTC